MEALGRMGSYPGIFLRIYKILRNSLFIPQLLWVEKLGNPFQQDVAVREQAGEDAPDDLLIADDALADFAGDEREVTLELFDLLVDFSDHAVRVARRPENSA